MVNTKKCEKCGWEYPISYPEKRCRFCGTRFKKRVCTDCGTYTDIMANGSICSKCQSKRVMRSTTVEQHAAKSKLLRDRRRKRNEDTLAGWLSLVDKVPQPLKTLTDEEWLAACLHFGKCAVCRNESIDARGFFIPFKLGGRYAAWNVIPVCDQCATTLKTQKNPFVKYVENIEDIVDYLQPILERTIKNE